LNDIDKEKLLFENIINEKEEETQNEEETECRESSNSVNSFYENLETKNRNSTFILDDSNQITKKGTGISLGMNSYT
jgi:hypothetical protein